MKNLFLLSIICMFLSCKKQYTCECAWIDLTSRNEPTRTNEQFTRKTSDKDHAEKDCNLSDDYRSPYYAIECDINGNLDLKENTKRVTCVDTSLLFNSEWMPFPDYRYNPKRRFRLDKIYYENDSLEGTYKLNFKCYLEIVITENHGRLGIPERLTYTVNVVELTNDTMRTTEWPTGVYYRKK